MGVSRDSRHKKKGNGGNKKNSWKKRKHESGRQNSSTTLSTTKSVKRIRVRGGNFKLRAISLNEGNFSLSSEAITKKTRIKEVVYNASSEYLVRTKKLVKGAIVEVDSSPYHRELLQMFERLEHSIVTELEENPPVGVLHTNDFSGWLTTNLRRIQLGTINDACQLYLRNLYWYLDFFKLDKLKAIIQNFIEKKMHYEIYSTCGTYLAKITSRPGQCGRADGYILEGEEYEFYMKKMGRSINTHLHSLLHPNVPKEDHKECPGCKKKLDSHLLEEHHLWCFIVTRGITDIDCPEVFNFGG